MSTVALGSPYYQGAVPNFRLQLFYIRLRYTPRPSVLVLERLHKTPDTGVFETAETQE